MSTYLALVPCSGCQRLYPRLALDTTGRCPTCPADDALPCILRNLLADTRKLTALAIAVVLGAVLTPWDHAALSERADATREAWIAAVEADGDADLPELPSSLSWDPRLSALVPAVGA